MAAERHGSKDCDEDRHEGAEPVDMHESHECEGNHLLTWPIPSRIVFHDRISGTRRFQTYLEAEVWKGEVGAAWTYT